MLKKINFISLGCAKNLVDSEKLMGLLRLSGFKVSFEAVKPSGIVIINTCGFINDAKEESVDTILQNVALKNQGKVHKIIVMGCLSQRYKNELINEIPEIDAVFGVNDYEAVLSFLNATVTPSSFVARTLSTLPHYAYLKIAEGCNRRCGFCIIPQIRGKHISLPIETIIEEARYLADEGIKELLVVAQDTTYYGIDIYKKRKIAFLLKKLTQIEGIEWIKLHYTYPADFPADVLELMAKEPKICPYIDIPLQHISTKVLKSMNRAIDKVKTIKLIEKIRRTLPNVAIRTSFIVGYPIETEKDFIELCSFVKEMKFDRVGVFKYSHEEGTPAYALGDKISEKIKQKRYNILMEIQKEISEELNALKVNKTYKVIIDSFEDGVYIARTAYDSPEVDNEVHIKSAQKLKTGQFYTVKIIDSDCYTLFAEVL